MQNLGEAPTFESPPTANGAAIAPAQESAGPSAEAVSLVATKSLREIFIELPSYAKDDFLRMGDLFERLAGRGHALLLIVLGIPACLIPGVSVAFGVAILLLSLQMALGRQPFLPRLLRDRKMRVSHYLRIQPRLVKIAGGLERLLHARLLVLFTKPWKMQVYGALVVVLAALLCLPLPIPFTNMLAGLPIIILGVALLERDGYLMIAGFIASLCAILGFSSILVIGVEGSLAIWRHLWD